MADIAQTHRRQHSPNASRAHTTNARRQIPERIAG
jgi:hypothetical protein